MTDTRLAVLRRANFRCEYCHESLRNRRWEREHILPRAMGGSDESTNLAASCSRCNGNKREMTYAEDPLSRVRSPLYNPRTQEWDDHFAHFRHYVVGRSSTGRATAKLLFKHTANNRPFAPHPEGLALRRHFPEIADELELAYGERKMQNSRAVRAVYYELTKPGLAVDAVTSAEIAAPMIESATSTSDPTELRDGIRLCSHVLEGLRRSPNHALNGYPIQRRTAYFAHKLAVSWWQLAVYLELSGVPSAAVECRNVSRAIHIPEVPLKDGFHFDELEAHVVEAAERGEIYPLLYVLDAMAAGGGGFRSDMHVRLFHFADELLGRCGYGQENDLVLPVLLERRVLMHKARLNPNNVPRDADTRISQWLGWNCLHQARVAGLEAANSSVPDLKELHRTIVTSSDAVSSVGGLDRFLGDVQRLIAVHATLMPSGTQSAPDSALLDAGEPNILAIDAKPQPRARP